VQKSVVPLFNPRVGAKEACQVFFGRRPQVKLPVVHTAVFAPTGVGKGTSFVIPFLLSCPDSCVVVDFKGENALATMKARKKMSHRVVLLDPFHVVTEKPDSFNPIDFMKADSFTALDECRDLAAALVVRTGQEKEPFWNDAAEMNIGAIASFVVEHAPAEDRSLQTIRGILASNDEREAAINVMRESTAWQGMLGRLGDQLTNFKDKELASTLTTTGRFLRFLDTLAICESTKSSSFDPAELVTGKMTVYLILPPEHMRAQSALLRMWIGSLLRAVVRGGLRDTNPVHFIIDEAASLGNLESLDDAIDKYRGYMVRLQLFYQSMGQLKICWPEGREQTLLSNSVQCYFGVNDLPTAEYVSARLGEATITVDSGGRSHSRSTQLHRIGQDSYSDGTSSNWSRMARKLLKPEEVLALDPRIAITFAPGIPPLRTRLVRYYEKSRQLGRFGVFVRALFLFLIAAAFAAMVLTGGNNASVVESNGGQGRSLQASPRAWR
jgi:type IV secretion system protein VirD4